MQARAVRKTNVRTRRNEDVRSLTYTGMERGKRKSPQMRVKTGHKTCLTCLLVACYHPGLQHCGLVYVMTCCPLFVFSCLLVAASLTHSFRSLLPPPTSSRSFSTHYASLLPSGAGIRAPFIREQARAGYGTNLRAQRRHVELLLKGEFIGVDRARISEGAPQRERLHFSYAQ